MRTLGQCLAETRQDSRGAPRWTEQAAVENRLEWMKSVDEMEVDGGSLGTLPQSEMLDYIHYTRYTMSIMYTTRTAVIN